MLHVIFNRMQYHVGPDVSYLWKLLTFDPSSVQRFPPSSWQTLTLDSWQRPSNPIDIALVSAPAPCAWRILPQGAVNLAFGCIWHMRCTDAQKQRCNKIVPEPNDNTTHIPCGELGQWQRHRLRQLWQKPGHSATERSWNIRNQSIRKKLKFWGSYAFFSHPFCLYFMLPLYRFDVARFGLGKVRTAWRHTKSIVRWRLQ